MKAKIPLIARWILGLLFFVFGLNGFLNFIPTPDNMPEEAMAFMGALAGTGYFFPVLKATETVCGLLLILGIAAPVSLVVLAPITIQIFLFHAVLTPGLSNLLVPIVIIALQIAAASGYWHLYRPLFKKG